MNFTTFKKLLLSGITDDIQLLFDSINELNTDTNRFMEILTGVYEQSDIDKTSRIIDGKKCSFVSFSPLKDNVYYEYPKFDNLYGVKHNETGEVTMNSKSTSDSDSLYYVIRQLNKGTNEKEYTLIVEQQETCTMKKDYTPLYNWDKAKTK